jgi:glucuronoarabinoxylan endo-1,4-beta-xylanase
MKLSKSFLAGLLFLLLYAPYSQAQTATVNWTNAHQVIDGFGASDAFQGPLSNMDFFYGSGTGQLGLSILRVGVTDGSGNFPGSCTSVGTSCAGSYVSDMQTAIADGAKIYASAWSAPAAYTSNGSVNCSAAPTPSSLNTADYALYATWLGNFALSLQAQSPSIPLYALSVQNEPNVCEGYDSLEYSAAQFDTFIKTNLGPTFSSDGLSTLIFMPEVGHYAILDSYGTTCMTDPTCYNFVGGTNWHEYDNTSYTAPDTVNSTPNPWLSLGKKYWETEASCTPGSAVNFCQSGFNPNITDALAWAAIIDDRLVNENANAWLYWWLQGSDTTDDQGLMDSAGTIAQRAYMLGQYARFIRPGYYRIDATHNPQAGVSVSAYNNASGGNLVIIATNYTSSPVTQSFTLTNAPNVSSVTPYITSSSLSIAAQAPVTVSSNSFTYSLPAQSITSFVGNATTLLAAPAPPTRLTAAVN